MAEFTKWKAEYYKRLEGLTLEELFTRYEMAAIEYKIAIGLKSGERVLWKLTVLENQIRPLLKPLQQYIEENEALKKRSKSVERNQERQIDELKKKIKAYELEKD